MKKFNKWMQYNLFVKNEINCIYNSKTQKSFSNYFVLITALISMLILLSGCMGAVIDTMARSAVTGDTYAEMEKTIPPPEVNKGRLYLYRTKDSTNTSVAINYGLAKNPTQCTIDDTAYEIIWEVFEYFDLSEGKHEITCGEDVVKSRDFWSGKAHFQKGKNKLIVSISNAAPSFVRVDVADGYLAFKPVLVEEKLAIDEISSLPYQDKQGFVTTGGKIEDP